jgi:hypothetical protein
MNEGTMKIDKLIMPSFNTTRMGVLKGAADYYEIRHTAPTLFGASGHAFMINISEELCPSGPYCWNGSKADPLIANLGLRLTDLGFFSPESGGEARADVERKVRDALDQGTPCSLINLENQLITGYDESGFFTAQPWSPGHDFPPARLSFSSWEEFGDSFHVSFFAIERVPSANRRTAILDSLDYAIDLHRNPAAHTSDGYGVGPEAYENWLSAITDHGSGHGNWWNATVWSECRGMAAGYAAEIGEEHGDARDIASDLEAVYVDISSALKHVSDKEVPIAEKVPVLVENKEKETHAVDLLERLATSLRKNQAA